MTQSKLNLKFHLTNLYLFLIGIISELVMFRIPKSTMSTALSTINTKPSTQTRKCLYASFECLQPCHEGYSYCLRHILEDPNAPFKQCAFIYNSNGRKCQNPAPKLDKRDTS